MNFIEAITLIAKEKGIIKANDIQELGLSRQHLYQLERDGNLIKIAKGCFALPEYSFPEHHDILLLSKEIPKMVVSLLSALSFHNLTTQSPFETWIALPKGSWRPRLTYPPIHISFLSEPAYSFGIEQHQIEGVSVQVYSVAKTIADCFKFRNQIGLDIAIEALKEAHKDKRFTAQEIYDAGQITRTNTIMRPYLEAIL